MQLNSHLDSPALQLSLGRPCDCIAAEPREGGPKRCTVFLALQARSRLGWAASWGQIILLCLSKQQ